jgi:extracellular elastinolytic metalloproteinase
MSMHRLSKPSHTTTRLRGGLGPLLSLLILVGQGVPAQAQLAATATEAEQNFDARLDHNRNHVALPRSAQQGAIQQLRDRAPGLAVSYDSTTGVTRTLRRRGGQLTAERPGVDAMRVARDFIANRYVDLGMSADDLADYEVTDKVHSSLTGVTHIYLRQNYLGLPVYNGQLQINVDARGRVLSVNNTCMPDIAAATASKVAAVSAAQAVAAVANHLRIPLAQPPQILSEPLSRTGTSRVRSSISLSDIEARLMWLPIQAGDARLVWNLQIAPTKSGQVFDLTVDATSGQIWTRFSWVAQDSYRVFPTPVESPSHSLAPPPADGRSVVTDPADLSASPFGWHDTDGLPGAEFTVQRGNNVHAYDDKNDVNAGICPSSPSPPASQPDCGVLLDCAFPVDFTLAPSQSTSAAVTNLFYWNNLIHDVQYRYGFDAAAGNFQANNYGAGGSALDYVLAEAQDGGGINNANMCTPPDGQRPRMQMFLWNLTTPSRDGDFDNGIIVHEYGHGISNRLVGGGSNVSCLNNSQQPGEGLSDWWALAYTAKAGDQAADGRGIGTYALGQPTSGRGFRVQRYSTDPSINTHTYESIRGARIPHGIGEVWAQGIWEVYWALVDTHGFSPNLHDPLDGFGNQRAMLYVNEGLKNTTCSPTFTDVRDGILLAAAGPPYNGEDTCLLWESFAFFGLGEDAVSGGPNSTTPTNGFGVPAMCPGPPTLSIVATVPTAQEAGPVSGVITITRTRDTSAAQDIFYTVSGDAVAGVDYAALSGSVNMTVGQTTATISVDPIDDILIEPNKQVVVTITPDPSYVIGGGSPGTATVTIVSEDAPPRVSIVATDPTATESGPSSGAFTITRALDIGRVVTVNYAVSGTATAGDDYVSLLGSVSMAVGQASAVVEVNPIDDSTPEPNETVVVTLLPDSAYTVVQPTTATLTIVSEPTVSVTASDATATEAGPTSGAFTVTRSFDTANPLTVNYVLGGTATPGADYAPLAGSVNMAASQTIAVIVIDPIDDAVLEFDDETVDLTLTPDPAYIVGVPAEATVAIVSDEARPIVTLSVGEATATESPLTSASFLVTRVDDITLPFTVDYFVTGQAIQGTDYQSIGTSAVIPAGQASGIIEIVPIDDSAVEVDESIQLILLSGPTYEAVSPVSIVRISSDDGIPLPVFEARWREDERRLDVAGVGAPAFTTVVVKNELGVRIGTAFSASDGSWFLRFDPLSINLIPPCVVAAGTGGVAGTEFPVRDTTTSCAPLPPPAPDTTAPAVSLTSPSDGSTISGTVPLSVDAADEAGGSGVAEVRVFLDGATGSPFATFIAPPYNLNWNTTILAEGSHTLQVEAEDGAGNVGLASEVTVTITTLAPSVPAASAGVRALIALGIVAGSFAAIRRRQFALRGRARSSSRPTARTMS